MAKKLETCEEIKALVIEAMGCEPDTVASMQQDRDGSCRYGRFIFKAHNMELEYAPDESQWPWTARKKMLGETVAGFGKDLSAAFRGLRERVRAQAASLKRIQEQIATYDFDADMVLMDGLANGGRKGAA